MGVGGQDWRRFLGWSWGAQAYGEDPKVGMDGLRLLWGSEVEIWGAQALTGGL